MRASPFSVATASASVARTRPRAESSIGSVVWVTAVSPSDGRTWEMYWRKSGFGPTTRRRSRSSRSRCSNSRNVARCSPTAVLPVPGPPCTTRHSGSGARMTSSCSAWIVATMSRISPVRARSSSASSGSGTPPPPSPVDVGVAEVLVEESDELGPVEREAAAALDAHRVGPRRSVERDRHRGAPVDDDLVAVAVLDVAPADVEPVAPLLVEPTERERHRRLGQRGVTALELLEQQRRVDARLLAGPDLGELDVARGAVAHRGEAAVRVVEVGLLGSHLGIGGGGHMGHGRARAPGPHAGPGGFSHDSGRDPMPLSVGSHRNPRRGVDPVAHDGCPPIRSRPHPAGPAAPSPARPAALAISASVGADSPLPDPAPAHRPPPRWRSSGWSRSWPGRRARRPVSRSATDHPVRARRPPAPPAGRSTARAPTRSRPRPTRRGAASTSARSRRPRAPRS